jgi:Putative Zn-dependent protease, contains TPR repeats
MAEYHRTLRDDLALTSTKKQLNRDWQKHSLEAIYHQLCQSPNSKITSALNQFLVFFDVSRRFALEWAETILQAGEDSENADVKSWGTKLIAGVKAFDEDENSEASIMFTELLDHGKIDNLSRSLSLDYRGSLYGRAELYDKALGDLNRAIELRPAHSNYWMDLGELYRRMKKYAKAIDAYAKAISLQPKSAKAMAGRGHAYLEMSRHLEALNDFSIALDLRANYAWALLGRGRVLAGLRRIKEARADFERAAQINAEYEHVAQKEVGNLLMAARRYADASDAFVKALSVGAQCIECWTSLVQSLVLALTPEQTTVAIYEALSINLRSRNLLSYQAEAFRRVGLLDFAIRDFDEAVLANPRDLRALRGRARTLLKMGRCDEALSAVNRLVEMEPNTAKALLFRGETLLRMKKPTDALKDFERVLGLDKGSVHIVQKRIGMALMQLGRAVDAKSAFIEALTAEPACAPCWQHLAKVYSKLFVLEDVPARLEAATIPNIDSPRVIGCRGEALLGMGFYDDALLAIEKAISLDPNLFLRFGNSYGLLLCCQDRFSDAVDVYSKMLDRSNSTVTLYNLAVAKIRANGLESAKGQIDQAETALNEDLKLPKSRGAALYGLAALRALRKEKSKALMLLEQAVKLEPASFRWIKQDVAWQDVRNEPRFQVLLHKQDVEETLDIAD